MYLRSFNKSLTSSKSNDKIQQPIYTETQDSLNKTNIKLTKIINISRDTETKIDKWEQPTEENSKRLNVLNIQRTVS